MFYLSIESNSRFLLIAKKFLLSSIGAFGRALEVEWLSDAKRTFHLDRSHGALYVECVTDFARQRPSRAAGSALITLIILRAQVPRETGAVIIDRDRAITRLESTFTTCGFGWGYLRSAQTNTIYRSLDDGGGLSLAFLTLGGLIWPWAVAGADNCPLRFANRRLASQSFQAATQPTHVFLRAQLRS
jgi:hypothetical protein